MSRSLSTRVRKLIRALGVSTAPALVRVPNQTGSSGRLQKIPRVVYQTAESEFVHPTHKASLDIFRGQNHDLDFILFNHEERDRYMAQHWADHPILDVYERAIFGQMKADIFRYCIVFERGGYYVDFNKGIDGRLTDFHLPEASGLVSYETNPELLFPDVDTASVLQNPFNLVMQWAFGFSKNHAFLSKLIDKIVEIEPFFRDKTFRYPKSALLTLTAPGVFTLVYREFVRENGLSGIAEAGEDFWGKGIFRLRGSKFLWDPTERYDQQENKPLLRSP